MRLAIILPRHMHYAADRATSVDLCARDFVVHSRFRPGITVIGEAVASPFADAPFIGVAGIGRRFGPVGFGDRSFAPVAEAIRQAKPEAILVHQYPLAAARVARAFPGIPVILQRHNHLPARSGVHRVWRDRAFRNLALVAFVSETARRSYTGKARSAVTYNGIDTRAFVPGPKQRTVLFAGRAVPEKGVEIFAKAAAAALASRPDWRAVMALGGGRSVAASVAAVRRHLAPLGPRAELMFDLPHATVMGLFAQAEIAVVPSVWAEPFGRTALEAMTCGAAVISSGRGGLTEVTGETAITTGTVDPADFAAAIARLIDTPTERARLQAEGRARAVERFDIRIVTAAFDGLLAEVAGAV